MAACIAAPKGRAGHKDPTARAKDKEQRPSHSDSDSVVSHKGELVTKTVSQSWREHLRQPQSFGNDRA